MKINVVKEKFLLCFRPTADEETIGLCIYNNQYAQREISFPKTQPKNHEKKRSLSRFLKKVLLGNAVTKRIRKRRRSTRNSELPLTKEPPKTSASDKGNSRTFTPIDAEDAIYPLSPSTSHVSFLTQETNYSDSGDGGWFKIAAFDQEAGLRQPKRTFGSAVSHRYVVYTLVAVFAVTSFWRFNGVFGCLACVWLYLDGGSVTPVFSGKRQTANRRRSYLKY